MDLLGSIMGSMDKPPSTTTEAERKQIRERKQQMQKWKQAEDRRIYEFKQKVRAKIDQFYKDSSAKSLKLEPMHNMQRAIVRELTDDAGLVSFSFGQEEVDRHVVIWKKEFAPSDDEIASLRRGEEWTSDKALEIRRKREEMEADRASRRSKKGSLVSADVPQPKSNYREKYSHILNQEVGKDAATTIATNKQYGNVKIENKQDRRTIEETLADRRAKRQKAEQATSSNPSDRTSDETGSASNT